MGIIEATSRKFIERKKKVLLLGGDHLVSYGAIKAASCACLIYEWFSWTLMLTGEIVGWEAASVTLL
jgi:hypothetical protein